jgi:hypothetical protein
MAFFTTLDARFATPLIGKPCLFIPKWDTSMKHVGKRKAQRMET